MSSFLRPLRDVRIEPGAKPSCHDAHRRRVKDRSCCWLSQMVPTLRSCRVSDALTLRKGLLARSCETDYLIFDML